MRSPQQSSMGMAPGSYSWPTRRIDVIVMAPMDSSTMRFLPFAGLDSQDESVGKGREEACRGVLARADLRSIEWSRFGLSSVAGQACAQATCGRCGRSSTDPGYRYDHEWATPYEYAKSMADQLSSAVLVTFNGEGHLAYGQSGCVKSWVDAYLVRNQVPRDGTRC